MFCCLRGEHVDGHAFAAHAVAAGAVALLVDHELPLAVPQVVAADTRAATGWLAASAFGHPSDSLTTIGITGTNGKTTTAHLLGHVLGAAGRRTEVFGTLTGAHTTPEGPDLQRRLAHCRDSAVQAVVMEVSSHALALHRVDGATFDVAVFTNLGRDHLDLHRTEERYFAAKARLFTPELSSTGVVNVDDVHGTAAVRRARDPDRPFSIDDVTDVSVTRRALVRLARAAVDVAIGGRFNVMNSLAPRTAAAAAGRRPSDDRGRLARRDPVPAVRAGRRGQDFAVSSTTRTPRRLTEALRAAARPRPAGCSSVFGCGGDRDAEKRPADGRRGAASQTSRRDVGQPQVGGPLRDHRCHGSWCPRRLPSPRGDRARTAELRSPSRCRWRGRGRRRRSPARATRRRRRSARRCCRSTTGVVAVSSWRRVVIAVMIAAAHGDGDRARRHAG
jgi:UDP-N-acetylmuramoyl-L-alanyl-D-glutamate--2,6-diaminopimelate ligase